MEDVRHRRRQVLRRSAGRQREAWYSPKQFEKNGYKVPTTWDELIALSDKILLDHGAEGAKPWCAGIGSGEATGWPATDWLEDMLLRTSGGDVYDKWLTNEVKFDSPEVKEALAKVGEILKNPDYVNGGYGDVASIGDDDLPGRRPAARRGGAALLHAPPCVVLRGQLA